jgi:hypothetical protein
MIEHTPGPWHAVKYATRTEILARRKAQRKMTSIALVYGSDEDDSEQADANARLIAAAPELLEALQDVLCTLTMDAEWTKDCYEVRKAEAAIAKATGAE